MLLILGFYVIESKPIVPSELGTMCRNLFGVFRIYPSWRDNVPDSLILMYYLN
jgi:hypothetical protein